MITYKRKLIEVALPLEVINFESQREKQPFTRNHPRSLHIWWARRPLVACRAVLFAQLVDDPSSNPNDFPTQELQDAERQRLFRIIEKLVVWENSRDERILAEARTEIEKSNPNGVPDVLDPFAGGGSIPVEAQRLGLTARASDLNPVAVLINRALIEIPPRWINLVPVFPGVAESKFSDWPEVLGLSQDVLSYGEQMVDSVGKQLESLYPSVRTTSGLNSDVLAWIWARTVKCANPACGIQMPLVRTFWLSNKKGNEAWIKPIVTNGIVDYEVVYSSKMDIKDGTVEKTGATCISCGTSTQLTYIRQEGKEKRIGNTLMAVILSGDRQKLFVAPTPDQAQAAIVFAPDNVPDTDLPEKALGFRVQAYGMTKHRDLFTMRQLYAMQSFCEAVKVTEKQVLKDALSKGMTPEKSEAYAKDILLYISLAISKYSDISNALASWNVTNQNIRALFARQAVPMSWDFAEANPFGSMGIKGTLASVARSIQLFGPIEGTSIQADAQNLNIKGPIVISTDPPYYANIGYADLSDFFYVWLRNALGENYHPSLSTFLTPKSNELIATPYRFDGSSERAEEHFKNGFIKTFTELGKIASPDFPITIYYAYKQTEDDSTGTASTGWETMLSGLIEAGLSINATWPIRTERSERAVSIGTNALASSIVLTCRQRNVQAEVINRRGFISKLKELLPNSLRELQQGSVAPVDMAQAAIGPGMSVFSQYQKVIEVDGSEMTVRTALALINQVLDEVLSEQEGEFDPETRFCIKWFAQYGWNEATSGEADTLSRAVNTSLVALERGGIFKASGGKARLLEAKDMSKDWNPAEDKAISIWEVAVRVATALQTEGAEVAAKWIQLASSKTDIESVKELSYLLFSLSEKRGWTDTAIMFNVLGSSWSDIAQKASTLTNIQTNETLFDLSDLQGVTEGK
jgi:putative DNA methylase